MYFAFFKLNYQNSLSCFTYSGVGVDQSDQRLGNDQQCLSTYCIDTVLLKLELLFVICGFQLFSYENQMVNSSHTECIDVIERDLER